MAKRKQRRTAKRGNPAPNKHEDDGGQSDEVGWSSIPGKRLDVDIATTITPSAAGSSAAVDGHHASRKKRHHHEAAATHGFNDSHNNHDDDNSSTSSDQYNIKKWTSKHYDHDDNYDGESDGEWDEKAEQDLFDPDPLDKTNKFDAGSKLDGANDAGMFFSLEVIPGDAYKVEKTGDETSGFVTKVVFTNKNNDNSTQDVSLEDNDGEKKPKAKKKNDQKKKDDQSTNDKAQSNSEGKGEEGEEKPLSRRERLKLKRKAKKEQMKERKRLKREQQAEKSTPSQESKEETKSPHKSASESTTSSKADKEEADQQASITALQTTWSITAPGVSLHTTLCKGLHSLNYVHPTPIQSATLPAAILGRRDIVGAAPTGSGKTLSYGLPILQSLLDAIDSSAASQGIDGAEEETKSTNGRMPLQALILTPTRELAIQVTAELQKVCCNSIKIGTIVGGFAEVKQKRTLEKTRPPILVATPGRLWELMSSKEYSHLNDLAQLRFLVIDEADRMIKQGSFPQLQQIFEVINLANPPPEDPDDMEDESSDDEDEDDRLKSLAGVRGEAKVVMLDDSILAAIERERSGGGMIGGGEAPKPMEMDDDEFEQQHQQLLDDESVSESEEEVERVHRQTFVYSATLTLPPSMHHLIKKDPTKRNSSKKRKGKQPSTVDGAIAEILDVAGARGETKIVNLSNTIPEGKKKGKQQDVGKKAKKEVNESSFTSATRLPPGLTLGEVRCAQRHKDSHLYAYLVTTRQGSSGPSLVFCNSIAAVRRVGETLKTLGLPVKMLHAQMAQKSRLGALESLRSSNSRSIVVASDVAARGLDITSVTTVIHYDTARAVDTFIHRAGRTARGVGEKAVGTSISLVAPAEEREHQKICEAVQGSGSKSLEQVHIDGRLLNEAQERVALATKIVSCNDVESQASRKNKWLHDAAKDAGLDVDEDMIEGGLLDGDRRDRQRFLEAKRAKAELRQLLAKPMRKQHFGKFLSGAGLKDSIKSEGEVKPFVVKESRPKGKHRRKKGQKKR